MRVEERSEMIVSWKNKKRKKEKVEKKGNFAVPFVIRYVSVIFRFPISEIASHLRSLHTRYSLRY